MATISWDTLIFRDAEQPVPTGQIVYPVTRSITIELNPRLSVVLETLCYVRGGAGEDLSELGSTLLSFVVNNDLVYDTIDCFVSGPRDTQTASVMCYVNNGHGVQDCYISVSDFAIGDSQPCYISASLELDGVQQAFISCGDEIASDLFCHIVAGNEVADTQPCFISSFAESTTDAVLAFVQGGSSDSGFVSACVFGKDSELGFLLSYVEGS